MNTIQNKKIECKLNLIKEHIEYLINYNNINEYSNIKEYTINIKYYVNNNYKYYIDVIRGTNSPEKTLTIRFYSDTKITHQIYSLFNKLIKNKNFQSTSYNINEEDSTFILNFKNNVKVTYSLKDNEDVNLANNIDNKPQTNKKITSRTPLNIEENKKDFLQEKKAKMTIKKTENIYDNIIFLNNIENYENIKPYKLILNIYIDEKKKCYKFDFKIIRGIYNKETIAEYSFSIKTIEKIQKDINNFINKYLNSEYFTYYGLNTLDFTTSYVISLKKSVQIEINSNVENLDFTNNLYKDEYVNILKLLK